eukprot:11155160-Alexandrium_andersonii.AAC.1
MLPFKKKSGEPVLKRPSRRVRKQPATKRPLKMDKHCVFSRAFHKAQREGKLQGTSGEDLKRFCREAAHKAIEGL